MSDANIWMKVRPILKPRAALEREGRTKPFSLLVDFYCKNRQQASEIRVSRGAGNFIVRFGENLTSGTLMQCTNMLYYKRHIKILLSSAVVIFTHLLSIPFPLLVRPSRDTIYVVNLRKLEIITDVVDWLTTDSFHFRLLPRSVAR